MIKTILIMIMVFFLSQNNELQSVEREAFFNSSQNCDYKVAVIGAGPAGIAVVGVLRDLGVEKILWIDPEFNIGRLSVYPTVVANNKNKFFVQFLESCKTFQECAPNAIADIKKFDLEKEYPLEIIIKPLNDITNCLRKKIKNIKGSMQSLYFDNDCWNISINDDTHTAYHVILATGSHPKVLDYADKSKIISLDRALDKSQLQNAVTQNDIIGVFGSSHSGILILKYLSEMSVKKIINFYNKPIQYMVDMGDWIFGGENGLKGVAAEWARNVLEKNPPANLIRIESKEENIKQTLSECTKLIYAIGFERNEIPTIKESPDLKYDPTTGIIAPRLFGIGIAFPEKTVDPLGNVEYRVGLNSFMNYAQRMIPSWIPSRNNQKQKELLNKFGELFEIEIL